jgi:isoleucyl-tRNA synthetase
VQNARKSAGLQVEDRIELALDGDAELIAAAETHRDYIALETLAVALRVGGQAAAQEGEHSEQAPVDGLALRITLRASSAR